MTSFLTSAVICLCWATLAALAATWTSYAAAYGRDRETQCASLLRVVLRYVTYGLTIDAALSQHNRASAVGMWLLLIVFVTHHVEVTTKLEPNDRVDISASIKRR